MVKNLKLPTDWKAISIPAGWVAAGVVAAFGGFFWLNDTFATRESVVVVQVQTNTLFDKQMEQTLRQINELERKKNKTADDRQHLDYLRKELEGMRQIKKGK